MMRSMQWYDAGAWPAQSGSQPCSKPTREALSSSLFPVTFIFLHLKYSLLCFAPQRYFVRQELARYGSSVPVTNLLGDFRSPSQLSSC